MSHSDEPLYRMLAPHETLHMARLHRDVYVMTQERAAMWYSLPHQSTLEESFGAFQGDTMVAGLSVLYYNIRLGGRLVPMGGVGGVATQPEHRHRGHIKHLLALALERMKERGVLVSMLFPFKYAFYRKYGWEHASDNLKLTLPMRALTDFKCKVSTAPQQHFTRVENLASALPALSRVYEAASARYNCIVARSGEHWDRMEAQLKQIERDGKNIYAYLGYRDSKPVSYIIYSFSPSGESRRLEVRESFAVDAIGYRGILHFLSMHDSQAHEVSWSVPVDSEVRQILAEPNGGQLIPRFMFRVVDVKGILDLFSTPRGPEQSSGNFQPFYMSISDQTAPWNNCVFRVSSTGVTCTSMETGGMQNPPDLAMDITVFSQIVSGYTGVKQAWERQEIEVNNPGALNTLEYFFPKNVTYCADYF